MKSSQYLNSERRLNLVRAFFLLIFVSTSGSVYAGYSPRTRSIGASWDLGRYSASKEVNRPLPNHLGDIVGIGIAGSNDRVYVWYADGTVSSGTSLDFEAYTKKKPFQLPEGKNAWDIIAMAIAGSNDRVYTWYADGTVSVGWSGDLGYYEDPASFELPDGKKTGDIVGMAIAGSNDRVYTWYADGTVSVGLPDDLDYYKEPYPYDVPPNKKIGHIIDMGITGSNDRVYTWYRDVELGSGHAAFVNQVDARAMDVLRRYRLPGLGVAVSKGGEVVLEKGYGYRDFSTGSRMFPASRCKIGSVSKVITALGAMHLHQENPGFSVDKLVYGPQGALAEGIYGAAQNIGIRRHQPIIAKAIASNDHVYTWYHNGTVSSGTSRDPDKYSGPIDYTLPAGTVPEDIRAIAISSDDEVWVWYDDGSYSVGNFQDLDAIKEKTDPDKVKLPHGYSMLRIVGIGIAPNNHVYVWYDDGKQSAGTATDFAKYIQPRPYQIPWLRKYQIRGIGIAKSNSRVYTWYNNNMVTVGKSQDLDFYTGPYPYEVPDGSYDPSREWGPWYDSMRVDHLLSHTAGFVRSGDVAGAEAAWGTTPPLTYRKLHLYMLATRKLLFAPGTRSKYSNHGLGLVGHIIAVNSGMSYRDYIRTHIIDPLGLDIRASSSSYDSKDALPHTYDNSGIPVSNTKPGSVLGLAAGGWKASARDLVRLMLATDGNPPDILSEDTLALMETRPYPGASTFALGWDKDGKGKLAHNGRISGGTAYMAKYPAGYYEANILDDKPVTVAVCTNIWISDKKGSTGVLRRLANEIAQEAARRISFGDLTIF